MNNFRANCFGNFFGAGFNILRRGFEDPRFYEVAGVKRRRRFCRCRG
jgi:hypothetical protein